MRRILISVLAFVAVALATPSYAVLPDEILDDPVLEARARALSAELRCLVCQNQSIDDSNAALARELRILVRDRLVAGDTDQEILDYLVDRYGQFVLLKPRFNALTAVLWIAPVVLLVGGGILAVRVVRRRSDDGSGGDLTPDEEQKLDRLLKSEPASD